MQTQNGMNHAHNYDIIVKWLAEALRGETLDVLGVKSGRIQEVFAFEPVEIAVQAGRVDVMLRDDAGALYHLEEQRNLAESDLYRFAAYYFLGAKQWGRKLTDIILASGHVSAGKKAISLPSGRYAPTIIDFSQRNGRARLAEIREAIDKGEFQNWLELVFLPLYGKETGVERSAMVEEVLRFETELYRADHIPVRLVVAALILSNKLIDKDRLREIWEEIKMLDIFEIAREEGLKEGLEKGIEQGRDLERVESTRNMLLEALIERFSIVSAQVSEQIRALQNQDVLKGLFHQALRCQSLQEFEAALKQVA